MPTIITTQVLPNNTVKLTMAFTDEDSAEVTPNDPTTWSLSDTQGNIINSRSSVDIAEGPSVDVYLSGDDLAPQGANDDGIRLVSVVGDYGANDYSLNATHAFVIGDAIVPVSLGDIKRNLIIDDDDTKDDYQLAELITGARQEVERVLDRKLITQTVTEYFDGWPSERFIKLPYGQLQSVTSLRYRDADGDWQTVSASNYIVETADDPGRIVLDDDDSWPTATLYESKPIEIVYACGYGALPAYVPFEIRRAIMLMVAEAYELRETFVIGTIFKRVTNPLLSIKYSYGLFDVR